MTAVAAAAIATGLWAWFVASPFVPLAVDGRAVEYVFVGAPLWWIGAIAVATAGCLVPLARRRGSGDVARPLIWLAVAPLALVALIPGVASRVPILFYILVDLRPWWSAAILLSVLMRLGLRPAFPRSPRAAGAALFAGLMAWAIATTPHLRFDASLHGDEPKYLRFCENWYQGNGLEVGNVRTQAELGPGFRPPLWRNASLFGRAVREDLALAAADLRRLADEGLHARFNRAEYTQAWIVRGRNGGYYQLHNPGLSALLFPGYFVDRLFVATAAGYQGVFPDRLVATNVVVVAVWAAWGVALFALLRATTGEDRASLVLSALVMMTMPMAAFGFQIYPEAAAGVIVCGVLAWLLKTAPGDPRVWVAIAAGVAVGFLPWLHVRLLVLSLVLATWTAIRARCRLAAFASYAVMIAALCAYSYHVSGSLRPDAMYAAQGAESAWIPAEARQSLISMPFDRIWGFLPHAPIYVLAIPGWILLARRSAPIAGGLLLLVLSLAVPVAGHGFTAAGATPLRQLASVLPLLVLPLWELLRAWGRARVAVIAVLILAVLSLDTAMSYNLSHMKHVGRYMDAGFSGWAPNLLFPWTHGDLWQTHRGTFVLFLAWIGLCVALGLLAASRAELPPRPLTPRAAALGIVAFVIAASGATALGGEPVRGDYFVGLEAANHTLVEAAVSQERCRLCFSSTRGHLGDAIIPATEQQLSVDPPAAALTTAEDVRLRVRLSSDAGIGWGSIATDFGDGTTTRHAVAGGIVLTHRYPHPGTYRVTIRFEPATGPPRQTSLDLTVGSR